MAEKNIQEVNDLIKKQFRKLRTESEFVPINAAVKRIISQNITAPADIPGFNRSTVDGYAVIASDTQGATKAFPAFLTLGVEVVMGEKPKFAIQSGSCAYVPAGGEIPEGADAVIMTEHTENYHDGYIYFSKPAAVGESIVLRGEDIAKGEVVLSEGTRLRAQDIGALASMGFSQVPVYRDARVGIISTGDEIVDITKEPQESQIRDVNSWMLSAGVQGCKGNPIMYGIIKDKYEDLQAVMHKALDECDLVIITGGSSAGTRDLMEKTISQCGKPGILANGISIHPGKQTMIADIGGKPVFNLPGYPQSAYFIFRLFIRPLIGSMQGNGVISSRTIPAVLDSPFASHYREEEYFAVKLDYSKNIALPTAIPLRNDSGLIMKLVYADGYVCIPSNSDGYKAGDKVDVIAF